MDDPLPNGLPYGTFHRRTEGEARVSALPHGAYTARRQLPSVIVGQESAHLSLTTIHTSCMHCYRNFPRRVFIMLLPWNRMQSTRRYGPSTAHLSSVQALQTHPSQRLGTRWSIAQCTSGTALCRNPHPRFQNDGVVFISADTYQPNGSCSVRQRHFVKAAAIGHRLGQLLVQLHQARVFWQLERVEASRCSRQSSYVTVGRECYGEAMWRTIVTHQRREAQSRRSYRPCTEVEQCRTLLARHGSNPHPEPEHNRCGCSEAATVRGGCLPIVHIDVGDATHQQLQAYVSTCLLSSLHVLLTVMGTQSHLNLCSYGEALAERGS